MSVRRRDGRVWLASVALSCMLHGACVLCFAGSRARIASIPELEVTMLEPEPLAAPEPPQPEPTVERAPEPEPPARAERVERARVVRPAVARAGALLTQPETASPTPSADEPVRFATDPNGHGYGSGMVARGGTADHAEPAAQASPAQRPTTRPGLGFAEHLSRQPSLASPDPCRGHFPQGARVNRGEVSVIATVRDHGTVARTEIERESPAGQGFGAAARACLAQQRFQPALDDAGKPTAARMRIRIAFSR